jgi:PAS domain S-box-containing protein
MATMIDRFYTAVRGRPVLAGIFEARITGEKRPEHLDGSNYAIDLGRFARALVARVPDAIVYADTDGMIQFWNAGAVRMFGFTEQEAVGKPLDIIVPANLQGQHWQGYHETMRTGQTRYGDGQMLAVPAMRKDGARLSVESTIVPFTGEDGRMVGLAAVMRDTTARFEELRSLREQLAATSAQ